MALPADRILIMFIAITGFIVLIAGWAGGLIEAQAEGWRDWALGLGVALALLLVLALTWVGFTQMDRKRG